MPDTVEQVILDVQSVCPDADPNLARLWVRNAGRRTLEAAQWSFLHRRGQFVIQAPTTDVSSGATCIVTSGSDEVTFSSGVATTNMVGLQFRANSTTGVYDIVEYLANNKLRIRPAYGGTTVSGSEFTISQMRLTLPSDCIEVMSVVSPLNKWQLWLNVPQEVLDVNDPSRERAGSSCLLSPCDYTTIGTGIVMSSLLATGSGAVPVSGGTYTGQDDAIFVLQVTTGGIGGVAVFKWKKNDGSFVTGIVSDDVNGNSLSDGVSVLWPSTSTFVLNDVVIVRTKAVLSAGSPRYELYPYPTSAMVLPYLYAARYPDLTDPGVALPGILGARTDVLFEKSLEFAASWPGTEDRPNPYNQINRRDYHAQNWMYQVGELVRQDRASFLRSVMPAAKVPFAPWPFPRVGNPQDYDMWYDYPIDMI